MEVLARRDRPGSRGGGGPGIKQHRLSVLHQCGSRARDRRPRGNLVLARLLEGLLEVRGGPVHRAPTDPPDHALPVEDIKIVPDGHLGDAERCGQVGNRGELQPADRLEDTRPARRHPQCRGVLQ